MARASSRQRIPVEGKDEIARLTTSFNRSAERVEQLVTSQKMLLANASHELRTPLTRLKLGIALMQGERRDDRRAQIEADIAELDHLIEEILLASRLDAGGEALALETVDLLGLAAEEASHFVDVTVEGQPVLIEGDGRLLRRLISNLLENANRHGRPPISVRVAFDKDRAVLCVEDHGQPIPIAQRDRIFEPFTQVRPETSRLENRQGVGLGLSLVRTIARRHAGEAELMADGGRGNIFRVTLPVSASRRVAATRVHDT